MHRFTSTGKLAAYQDISKQLPSDAQLDVSGPNNYDLRFLHTNQTGIVSKLNTITNSRLQDPACSSIQGDALKPVTQSSWDTATPTEFLAVCCELITEIQNSHVVQGYLTGGVANGGILGLLGGMNGADETILSNALNVANNIGQDSAIASVTSTQFSAATSDWLNLAEITVNPNVYVSNFLRSFDPATDSVLGDTAKMATAGNQARNISSLSPAKREVGTHRLQTSLLRPMHFMACRIAQTTCISCS